MDQLRVSIITPTHNSMAFLRPTAECILSQQGDFELEWIVVDGRSSDGTVEFLRGLNDPRIHLTSESDRGQSDAINRGLARATGEIVGWLNSDDLYLPGTLDAVASALGNDAAAEWLIGQCGIINASGQEIRQRITDYKNRRLANYSYRALLRENFISQPAVFWRRSFGTQVGPLDESLHYTMDYDLWLRMGREIDPLILNRPLSQFRLHATSKSGQVNRRQFDEGYEVARRHAEGDDASLRWHRLHVEKIVWSYRAMRLLGL